MLSWLDVDSCGIVVNRLLELGSSACSMAMQSLCNADEEEVGPC